MKIIKIIIHASIMVFIISSVVSAESIPDKAQQISANITFDTSCVMI